MKDAGQTDIVILGAGCAGLSLCWHLLSRGYGSPILILDGRREFADDRTWCFWDVGANPFAPLAAHRWERWRVRGEDGLETVTPPARHAYLHLRARDFYDAVLEKIARHANVTVRLDEPAGALCETADGVEVRTSKAVYRARRVADSRPFPPLPGVGVTLSQSFRGWFVRAPTPVFDPSVCTLMDFDVPQEPGELRFFYVLPFSPTEALVESTAIGEMRLDEKTHGDALRAYLSRHVGPCEILREERGEIPMTTRRFDSGSGRVRRIGIAGGASKPSSGYTFTRIQSQCARLAAEWMGGCQKPAPALRRARLDAIFLRTLAADPSRFPAYFFRLFAAVPPDVLARFLGETDSLADAARVLCALPPGPFLRAALAS